MIHLFALDYLCAKLIFRIYMLAKLCFGYIHRSCDCDNLSDKYFILI